MLFYTPSRKQISEFGQKRISDSLKNSQNSLQQKLYFDMSLVSKELNMNCAIFNQLTLDHYGRIKGIVKTGSSNSDIKTSIQINNYLLNKIIDSEFLCIQFQHY